VCIKDLYTRLYHLSPKKNKKNIPPSTTMRDVSLEKSVGWRK